MLSWPPDPLHEYLAVLHAAGLAKHGPRVGNRRHVQGRKPFPVQLYGDGYVLRRLAPNGRKVDFNKMPAKGRERLVRAMAGDLASVHGKVVSERNVIAADFGDSDGDQLVDEGSRVAAWTEKEFAPYRESHRGDD